MNCTSGRSFIKLVGEGGGGGKSLVFSKGDPVNTHTKKKTKMMKYSEYKNESNLQYVKF